MMPPTVKLGLNLSQVEVKFGKVGFLVETGENKLKCKGQIGK